MHGCDSIPIRLIKYCGKSIALPLILIVQCILDDEFFSHNWKQGNVVPYHKKETNSLIKKLLSWLLSIIHEIYKSFDCKPPVADRRGTF